MYQKLLLIVVFCVCICSLHVQSLYVEYETINILYADHEKGQIIIEEFNGTTGDSIEKHVILEQNGMSMLRSVYDSLKNIYYITMECNEEDKEVLKVSVDL